MTEMMKLVIFAIAGMYLLAKVGIVVVSITTTINFATKMNLMVRGRKMRFFSNPVRNRGWEEITNSPIYWAIGLVCIILWAFTPIV